MRGSRGSSLAPGCASLMSAATSSDAPSESHVLLDVPPDVGEQLHAWLANSAAADVSVEIAEDRNAATLTVNGTRLPGALTTLPTVVETHTSLDGVTFYKSGEIGKVLVARHTEEDLPEGSGVPFSQAAELPERADGLTVPTANVRKKMWRKRPVRDPREVEQVAVELEALKGGSLKVCKRPTPSNAALRHRHAHLRLTHARLHFGSPITSCSGSRRL